MTRMSLFIYEEYAKNNYNAISKARQDVSRIVLDCGFKSIAVYNGAMTGESKILKAVERVRNLIELAIKIRRGDYLFVQTNLKVLPSVLSLKKKIGFRIIYLIHDALFVRYDNIAEHQVEIATEVDKLNDCDFIICHNERMKEKLTIMGVKSKLLVLGLFDYLISDGELPTRNGLAGYRRIAYAGDIKKSPFIFELDKISHNSIEYNIYGKFDGTFKHLNYKGALAPEELPYKIEADFGLVWDGKWVNESTDYYSRFNNPHKISMHIVAGLPSIIWSGSALAQYIQMNKLGIVIQSLDELDSRVMAISNQEYIEMVQSCNVYRKLLTSGNNLKSVISSIIQE